MADRDLMPSLAVAVSGGIWGLYWLPVGYFQAAGVGGAELALAINLFAFAAVLPVMLLRRRPIAATWRQGLGSGVLMGLAFTLYSVALMLTDVVHAILLFYITPVWSTLLARLTLGEPITRARLAALGLGLGGLFAVLDTSGGFPWPRNLGDWLSLAASFAWAIGSLRLNAGSTIGTPETVGYLTLGGALTAVPFVVHAAVFGTAPSVAAIGAVLPILAGLGILVLVPVYTVLMWGARRLSPGRVGILLMLEVVVGVASSALLSEAAFGSREALGATLIIAAGLAEVLVGRQGRRVETDTRAHG